MQGNPSVGQPEDFSSPTGGQPNHVTPPSWSQPYGIPSTSPEEVRPWWVYAMVGVGTLLLLVGLVGSFAATAGNLFFLILCDVAGLLLLLYGRHLYRGYSTDS